MEDSFAKLSHELFNTKDCVDNIMTTTFLQQLILFVFNPKSNHMEQEPLLNILAVQNLEDFGFFPPNRLLLNLSKKWK